MVDQPNPGGIQPSFSISGGAGRLFKKTLRVLIIGALPYSLHPSSPKDALVTDCRSCSRRQTRLHRRGGRPRRPCCRQRWQQGPRPRIRLAVGEPFCIMGGHAAAAAPAVPATAAAVAAAPATPGAHHHAPHPEAAAAAPHEKLELGAGRLGRVLGAAPGNA